MRLSLSSQALKTAGIDSFESLATADARKIESVTGRNYPFGDSIKSYLPSLGPKIDINIEDAGNRQGKSTIIVTLTRLSQAVGSSKQNYADMVPSLTLFWINWHSWNLNFYMIFCQVVGSEEDNAILFHEKIKSVVLFSQLISFTVYYLSFAVYFLSWYLLICFSCGGCCTISNSSVKDSRIFQVIFLLLFQLMLQSFYRKLKVNDLWLSR